MNKDLKITLDNLKIALEQLPKKAIQFPHIKEEFNIASYGCMHNKTKMSDCGTQGCLLGNMVHVFKPIKSDFNRFSGKFSYWNFGRRLFPALYVVHNFKVTSNWWFLFNSRWIFFDNTFEGAMQRIKYFIEKNGDLGEWKYEDFKN